MDRRSFLKNSIGALLFTSLTSNKILAGVVETLTPDSPKVLLYLIQLKTGEWKIKATKWVDVPKKRLREVNVIKESFKPLEIVDISNLSKRRDELWDLYKCTGRKGHLLKLGIEMTNEIKNEYIGLGKRQKGKILSTETKNKISKIKKGVVAKEETKEKLREIAKETKQYLIAANVWSNKSSEYKKEVGKRSGKSRTGRKASEQHKKNISNALKGRILSDEHKKNLSISKTGKKMDEGQKERYKLLFKGERNPMYGKTHNEETRKKISNNPAYKIERTCPYCDKTIIGTNYFRHHGDRCKLNLNK